MLPNKGEGIESVLNRCWEYVRRSESVIHGEHRELSGGSEACRQRPVDIRWRIEFVGSSVKKQDPCCRLPDFGWNDPFRHTMPLPASQRYDSHPWFACPVEVRLSTIVALTQTAHAFRHHLLSLRCWRLFRQRIDILVHSTHHLLCRLTEARSLQPHRKLISRRERAKTPERPIQLS